MSRLVLHDSGRSGKVGWMSDVLASGRASRVIISPWETPPTSAPRRPSASSVAEALRPSAQALFFDPETHGVFFPGSDRFEIYDQWRIWGDRNPEKSEDAMLAHARTVLRRAADLGLTPILPTVCLESPVGDDADLVVSVAQQAVRDHRESFVAVVGTPQFWRSGRNLDTFVGRLVRSRPAGWLLSGVRATGQYPWQELTGEEVAGLCRTVHSLSARGDVMVGRSDLAGLACLVAGASLIGTGWDLKQRIASPDLYRNAPGVRRMSQRVTHQSLLAALKRQEAERLAAGDPALSGRLVPGGLPLGFNAHWRHHLEVLDDIANDLVRGTDRREMFRHLRRLYIEALDEWDAARDHARPIESGPDQWIQPLLDGLNTYGAAERL